MNARIDAVTTILAIVSRPEGPAWEREILNLTYEALLDLGVSQSELGVGRMAAGVSPNGDVAEAAGVSPMGEISEREAS